MGIQFTKMYSNRVRYSVSPGDCHGSFADYLWRLLIEYFGSLRDGRGRVWWGVLSISPQQLSPYPFSISLYSALCLSFSPTTFQFLRSSRAFHPPFNADIKSTPTNCRIRQPSRRYCRSFPPSRSSEEVSTLFGGNREGGNYSSRICNWLPSPRNPPYRDLTIVVTS